MIQKEAFLYKDETYTLLLSEHDNLLKSTLNQEPYIGYYSDPIGYLATFCLDNYHLCLKSISTERKDQEDLIEFASDKMELLCYNGGIIIAKDFVEAFGNEDIFPCYCYQNVTELIFNEGILITSIDHSKAMTRIRKNIIKGLRDIHNKRDNRCIRKFIKESLVGNYTSTMKKKLIRSRISKLLNQFHL